MLIHLPMDIVLIQNYLSHPTLALVGHLSSAFGTYLDLWKMLSSSVYHRQ